MSSPLPQVVIVGAGAPVQVTLVDQNNYHLFQPLLYQVATAGVSATDFAYPVRAIFRKQANFTFRMATVSGVDFNACQVLTERGSSIAAPICDSNVSVGVYIRDHQPLG